MSAPRPDWEHAFRLVAAARAATEAIVEAVEDGSIGLEAAFDRADADPLIARVSAVKVLEVVPGIGKVRSRRTMDALGIAPDATLAGLDEGARRSIVEAFESQ